MPLQLACNYSRPLLDLLSRGATHVDWIKLSHLPTLEEDLRTARPVRPVLLHTLGRAGRRPEEWEDYPWDALRQQLAVAGSPHIAFHLDLRPHDWDGPLELRCQGRGEAQAMLERLAATIRLAQQRLPVPVLFENIPYYGGNHGAPRIAAQPEAMWQVVEATGAGMLLDTGHLRCSAYHLGVDVRAYARALPLGAVREVHASGPRLLADLGLRDRHYELLAEDYHVLEWVLGHSSPAILTLEYGGTGPAFETPERNDPAALERQIQRLEQYTQTLRA